MFIFIFFFSISSNVSAQENVKHFEFPVAGNCGMCKKRIEDAIRLEGVKRADWNVKTGILSLNINTNKISQDSVQRKIAEAGHDTPLYPADDTTYNQLHSCCLYDRLHLPRDSSSEQNNDKEKQVTGVVVDENSKGDFEPIPSVNVTWLEDKSIYVQTDEHGVFKINHSPSLKNLVFTYAGMAPDTIQVTDANEVLMIRAKNNLLEEVVISKARKSRYISNLTTSRVEVLSTRELFKAACCDLSESFETNASVDVVDNDAVTGSKQIQMLGLSGVYTQLTVENLPGPRGLATPLGLNSIAGSWIESIEISKGIGSVVNGFENMAGQINVELKKPNHTDKLFFNIYGNNMGRSDINLNIAHQINENWSTGILLHDNFMYNKNLNFSNNGFRDMPVGNLFSGINRWHYENGKGIISQFGVKFLHDDRTGGQINFDKQNDFLTKNNYGLGFTNKRIEGFSKLGYVFPNHRLRSLGLQVSGFHYKQDSYFGLNTYLGEQSNLYANFIFQDVIGSVAHKYKIGASFVHDGYKENVNQDNYKRTENVAGFFLEYTYSPKEYLDAVLSIRQDHNSLYGWFTTPRAIIKVQPALGTTIRLSSGRGQRTANIFAENLSMFASSREIKIDAINKNKKAYGLKPEVSWNSGISLDKELNIFGKESSFSLEFYHNNFQNQIVVDYEDVRSIRFYNLEGKSYSNSIQSEFNIIPINNFSASLAYRYLDVKTTYQNGLLEKPLTAKHRAFLNLGYSKEKNWNIDYTLNMIGKKRLPSTVDNPIEYQVNEYSEAYITMNLQLTKTFGRNKNFDIYIGAENLTNYYQKDPILAYNDPFGEYFDTNLVWGPIYGRMFYSGLRFHI